MLRKIGETGIEVTAIGLGAMPLSLAGRPDEVQAIKVIEAFVGLGGNFIDTANVYCLDDADIGHNERLVDKALRYLGKRDEVLVATKCGLRRPRGNWTVDGDPAWIRASCEQSLKDLNAGAITLCQLHAVDPKWGLEPAVETLLRLREEGKIRHIGLSNVNLAQLREALALGPIVAVQNSCNPFQRQDFSNGLADFCRDHGITYIAHSPVGGYYDHAGLARQELLARLAEKYRVSTYRVVLAWLLGKGAHILPIPGASKVASITDSMGALSMHLDPEDAAAIDGLPQGR